MHKKILVQKMFSLDGKFFVSSELRYKTSINYRTQFIFIRFLRENKNFQKINFSTSNQIFFSWIELNKSISLVAPAEQFWKFKCNNFFNFKGGEIM